MIAVSLVGEFLTEALNEVKITDMGQTSRRMHT